jgi:large subunit ribosomal protein L24e
MHKKGITEEVAKKRSRKTVKHQRGIVGADLNAILARRNQTAAERTAARTAAINKAKDAKKEKDAKKDKPKVRRRGVARCRSVSRWKLTLAVLV